MTASIRKAVRENWGAAVGFAGLEWLEASVATAEDRLRAENTFRASPAVAKLRRFVESLLD